MIQTPFEPFLLEKALSQFCGVCVCVCGGGGGGGGVIRT